MKHIPILPMTADGFEPFGDLIDFNREFDFQINNGNCDRYHALAETDVVGAGAKTIISLGRARPYSLPLELKMMERHPLGSQAFIPMSDAPFLVVVAPDDEGKPGEPVAFMTQAKQGVNYQRNTWHAVLCPLNQDGDFIIVDRGGEGDNLVEYFFETPYLITTE